MMSNLPRAILLFSVLFIVYSDALDCKQCEESDQRSCTKDQKCSALQERCLVIRWGSNHKSPNTYTMRCATRDECSDPGRKILCPDKNTCEARCCDHQGCDPYHKNAYIIPAERQFHCHQCEGESLDSCTETKSLCDDDQSACISFLMEGGNLGKVYTKRCARKDECSDSERQRLCDLEMVESQRKTCRSSCCFDELCNTGRLIAMSLYLLSAFLMFSLIFVLN